MDGFVIAEIEVKDAEAYEEYKRQVAPTVEAFGGTYVVRGGSAEALEGGWEPRRIVVLRFESPERAREWYGSEMYEGPKKIRQAAARSRLILVEGAS